MRPGTRCVRLRAQLLYWGVAEEELEAIEREMPGFVERAFRQAADAAEPEAETVAEHVFAPTPVVAESGDRAPSGGEKVIMVDAALFAIRELMEEYPEALLYGQDVGRRLGGVFREAATLAEQFGDHPSIQYCYTGSVYHRLDRWDECGRGQADR